MGNLLSKNKQQKGSGAGGAKSGGSQSKGGNGGGNGVTEYDRSVLELKLQRDKLNKQAKAIHRFSERQSALAVELLKKEKREQALICLRRKRLHEGQLRKVENLMANVEKMIQSVEFAAIEHEVVHALKSGADAIKDLQKQMSIDDIERIVDDAAEAIAVSKEVGQLLADSLTPQDEDAVMKELDDMQLAELGPVPNAALPKVEVKEKEPEVAREAEVEEDAVPEEREVALA